MASSDPQGITLEEKENRIFLMCKLLRQTPAFRVLSEVCLSENPHLFRVIMKNGGEFTGSRQELNIRYQDRLRAEARRRLGY
jgi:hypothetical protein